MTLFEQFHVFFVTFTRVFNKLRRQIFKIKSKCRTLQDYDNAKLLLIYCGIGFSAK